MTEPPEETNRSFARVEVVLPVRVRPVSDDEARAVAERLEIEPSYQERLSAEFASAGQRSSEQSFERLAMVTLLERMDRLERCLDKIALALDVPLDETDSWLSGETVSISGSGLGLRIPRKLDEGTLVETEITLLGETTGVVRLLGRIVSLVHPDGENLPVGRYHLGIAFEALHEEDREAIIHYTFRLQRAQLREMRRDD